MCGIAGYCATSRLSPSKVEQVRSMQRLLTHRGPDDGGFWESATAEAVFAHNRLSIIDLSPLGRQPMPSSTGRYAITFNGEIYNFQALRRALEEDGVRFISATDTEVILHLYEKEGPSCVRRLQGMFAFAIWDEKAKSCFIARDAFGIKPLYYALPGQDLAFASELRPLVQTGLVTKALDPASVSAFFRTGSVPEPGTLLADVRCLPAGHTALWRQGQFTLEHYWKVRFPTPENLPLAKAAEQTRRALQDSIDRHFVSDVPVGIFLSGGIDSTAVLALARASGKSHLHTYSIALDQTELNEGPLARRTAEHFGATHHELKLDAELGRTLFDEFLDRMDQPSIDGFNTYVVSWFARQQNAKVVLSGLGGDEVFGGYSSFQKIPRLWKACRMLTSLPGMGKLAGRVLRSVARSPRLRRLGALLGGKVSLPAVYETYRGIFTPEEAEKLAQHATGAREFVNARDGSPALAANVCDAISELELTRYMRNQLLRDSDVMSMAHGLELRVPLVDSTLFDSVAALPATVRLRPSKQLLLDAVPEIPDWIRNQPKRGFLFPYAAWLESPRWKPLFDKALADKPVTATAWYQRWSMFVFDRWCARYLAP